MMPVIDRDNCISCCKCIDVCPPQAILLQDGTAFIVTDLCEECGFCAVECPVSAIEIPFPMSALIQKK